MDMASSPSPKEKRLVVVGNAPVVTSGPIQPKVSSRFLKRFINESDLVIRMNDVKNRGARGVGRRTDILAIMNTVINFLNCQITQKTCGRVLKTK